MLLIVGLGNPGKKYQKTYHNIGIEITKKKEKSLIYEGHIEGKKVILAKPQTFMNLSGKSVYGLAKRFNIDFKNILIIYDDVDLDAGNMRFRASGSGGTHNGMKHIVEMLKTKDIKRLRVGIGKDLIGRQSLANYVLSNVKKGKKPLLDSAQQNIVELIDEFIIKNGELENKSIQ